MVRFLATKSCRLASLHGEWILLTALSFPIDELSNRERQVLDRLGRGQSVDTIAADLDLSRKTIETHRRRAKDKLGLDTVRELVQYAVQWTQSPEPTHRVEA
jgi:DNA-binding CsgD family transcriptional regulator